MNRCENGRAAIADVLEKCPMVFMNQKNAAHEYDHGGKENVEMFEIINAFAHLSCLFHCAKDTQMTHKTA
jgi:hypothetical protein